MRRLMAMIVKESWALLRDPKSRIILVLPPLLQLFIFTYATTLDVRNVDVGLLDRLKVRHSQAEPVSEERRRAPFVPCAHREKHHCRSDEPRASSCERRLVKNARPA